MAARLFGTLTVQRLKEISVLCQIHCFYQPLFTDCLGGVFSETSPLPG